MTEETQQARRHETRRRSRRPRRRATRRAKRRRRPRKREATKPARKQKSREARQRKEKTKKSSGVGTGAAWRPPQGMFGPVMMWRNGVWAPSYAVPNNQRRRRRFVTRVETRTLIPRPPRQAQPAPPLLPPIPPLPPNMLPDTGPNMFDLQLPNIRSAIDTHEMSQETLEAEAHHNGRAVRGESRSLEISDETRQARRHHSRERRRGRGKEMSEETLDAIAHHRQSRRRRQLRARARTGAVATATSQCATSQSSDEERVCVTVYDSTDARSRLPRSRVTVDVVNGRHSLSLSSEWAQFQIYRLEQLSDECREVEHLETLWTVCVSHEADHSVVSVSAESSEWSWQWAHDAEWDEITRFEMDGRLNKCAHINVKEMGSRMSVCADGWSDDGDGVFAIELKMQTKQQM